MAGAKEVVDRSQEAAARFANRLLPGTSSDKIECPECGEKIDSNESVCPECGTEL